MTPGDTYGTTRRRDDRLHREFAPVIAAHATVPAWDVAMASYLRFLTLVWAGEVETAAATVPLGDGSDTTRGSITLLDRVDLHKREGILAAVHGDWGAGATPAPGSEHAAADPGRAGVAGSHARA